MLFEHRLLKSKYDFDQFIPDDMANLNSLATEIAKQTDLIYSMWKQNSIIYFHHKDQNNQTMIVDVNQVSVYTWNRSIHEIKEILYRDEDEFGNNQMQFSISKNLKLFHIQKPENDSDYKQYLQLLYFFYMMNYFAFPKVNIFKKLSEQNSSFITSYDEGTSEGSYLYFMMSNIMDNKDAFKMFVQRNIQIEYFLNDIAQKIQILSQNEHSILDFIQLKDENNEIEINNDSVLNSILMYFNLYSLNSYRKDMLFNLTSKSKLFEFDKLDLPPFEHWKKQYVKLEEIDEFLKDRYLYWFCKQKFCEIKSKDRIKFLNSNAVQFFKTLIQYDKQWMELFDEQEGLVIEIIDGCPCIYALRIAIVIKTYNDLINKAHMKVKTENINWEQSLRTALNVKNQNYLPATLSIRLFLLACHSQYLNAIHPERSYEDFLKEFYIPEVNFLNCLDEPFKSSNYQELIYQFNLLEISINDALSTLNDQEL